MVGGEVSRTSAGLGGHIFRAENRHIVNTK
jgi:hypothetical protein